MTRETPTVLVVDDERDLADLYAAWLSSRYRVRTAYGGEAAIEAFDADVDVALIDRLMPHYSGDDVVEYVARQGYDCRISMVTAVEPDFDIIEMGFDEYVVKPLNREDLLSVVEALLSRTTYDRQLQEFFSLASKRAALQSQKQTPELATSEAYQRLSERIAEMQEELMETTDRLSERDFEVQLRKITVNG